MATPAVHFFRSNALLDGLPGDAVEQLAAVSRPARIGRRGVLWQVGDASQQVFWIRSGVVKISAAAEAGRELTLELHARGALVGEGSVLSGEPRHTIAEAYEECSLYATPAAELGRLIDRDAALGRRLSRVVCGRRDRLEARLGTLLFRSSQARLATLLLELAGEFGVRDSRGVIVNLKLPHRELAALIGSSRETVSFGLIALRKAGLVQADGKRLVLLDEVALAGLCRA